MSHPYHPASRNSPWRPLASRGMEAAQTSEPAMPPLACTNCRSAHQVCSRKRPCTRCTSIGEGDTCYSTSPSLALEHNVLMSAPLPRKRGRPRKTPITGSSLVHSLERPPPSLVAADSCCSTVSGSECIVTQKEMEYLSYPDYWGVVIDRPIVNIDADGFVC